MKIVFQTVAICNHSSFPVKDYFRYVGRLTQILKHIISFSFICGRDGEPQYQKDNCHHILIAVLFALCYLKISFIIKFEICVSENVVPVSLLELGFVIYDLCYLHLSKYLGFYLLGLSINYVTQNYILFDLSPQLHTLPGLNRQSSIRSQLNQFYFFSI